MTQMIRVAAGDYLIDPPIYVDPATIDPEITRPEDAQWNALAAPFSPQKLWEGIFSIPVDPIFADCWPSQFGSRRSYNDSEYIYFHTGLDFCGSTGNPIYAPASGIVVFAGPLTVRGNATMIDHGWGIYSAYMHQSEILVNEGERVETGQLIGRVGSTGRVTGPHLHFEVWVGGIQVDPLDWLRQIYP
jgi:murein DD-endopeptidase MepM/ murein hydrolase activator NlpD